MPTYEYECRECGETFERFQSIKDSPLRRCPSCGKRKVRRLIGAGAGIIFRGSGFYQTDYRSDEYKAKAKAEKGGSEGPKSDTKAEKGGAKSGDDGKKTKK